MFGLTALQLIAILLLTEIVALDSGGPQTQVISKPLFVGAVIGALLGDLKQGLFIGGTLKLMSMGIVGLGGASVPNYIITTIITTIVAIQSGEGYEIGLAVGLPVGMLFVNLDVLHKILNGYVMRWSQKSFNEHKFDKGIKVLYLHLVLMSLKYLIPVVVVLIAGQAVTETIVAALPTWLFNGMKVAGKILPVTGMAMLLNYMPVKKNFLYLCIGFVMYAYMGVGTLGVAIIGFGLAFKYYFDKTNGFASVQQTNNTNAGGLEDE